MSQRRKKAKRVQITPNHQKVIYRVEVGVASVLLLMIITLHVIFLFHAGGFWRDEANSINLVNMIPVLDFGEKFQTESFPLLWVLLLRAWIFIGLGGTDLALRLLGLIIGLGFLGALWYVGRTLGSRIPVIALALFAMSPVVFSGDSLRAYGLGALMILLSMAAMWSVLKKPTLWRMAACAAIVILTAQCLYHNAFLIFSVCMGAAAVGLYRRQWRLTAFPIGVGILAAASYVPYLVFFTAVSDWHKLIQFHVDFMWFVFKIKEAVDPSGFLLTWIWVILALLAVMMFIWMLVKSRQVFSIEERELALFLLTIMLLSIIAYFVFIKVLSRPTESWYYLSLIAVLIVIIDRGVEFICSISTLGRMIRITCVVCIAIFLFTDSWNAAHTRKTNIDVLAAKLEMLADKNDFVVLTRFYYGVSFWRYYKGSAPWATLPEIADHSVHRYDLLKDKMMEKEPIKPLLQKMTQTLQNGHKVWVVGRLNFLRPGVIPRELPPAPDSPYRWSEIAYESSWLEMAAFTLQTYGQTLKIIPIHIDDPVYEEENLPLMVVQKRFM
jgi:hypothetical protein